MTASDAPRAAQRRVFALLIDSLDDEHQVDGDPLEELRLTFEAVVGLASLRRARG